MSIKNDTIQVFLSYSHNDRQWAERIGKVLKKSGLDVWDAANELLPGDSWAHVISKALEESDAMVVLLSADSVRSQWLRNEIEFALGNKSYSKRLIPVLLGREKDFPTESVPWILKNLQMVRLTEPEKSDKSITQIAENLKKAA